MATSGAKCKLSCVYSEFSFKFLDRIRPFDRFGRLVVVGPLLPAALAGTVCIGSGDGSLHALHATDGTLRWKAQTQGRFLSTPAIADDRVYVGASDGYLYAFHLESGRPAWTTFIPGKLQVRAQTTMLQHELHFEIIPPEQEPEA